MLGSGPLLVAQAAHSRGHAARPAHEGAAAPQPTGPVVVIDTTMGRLTCRLFTKEAPQTTANFVAVATGARAWPDPATGAPVTGKPFYDGTALIGVTDGIAGGDRAGLEKGTAGPGMAAEKVAGISLTRAGLMGMRVNKGEQSSSIFSIMDHGDLEAEGRVTPFGLCDEASIARVAEISHVLLAAGNHPEKPVAINAVRIVQAGAALPAPAAEVAAADVVPQYGPEPPALVPAPEPTGPTAVIETSMGTLTCRLFTETPTATQNFIGLATGTKDYKNAATHATVHGKPFYNGLHFGRVIPDFMVQQSDMPGDPQGGGSVGFQFANEIVPGLTFDRPGRLAYANSGPTTNSSEWFVTEHTMHRLDGLYTIFGQCDAASVKVVEAIARVPRDARNKPLQPVVIKSVRIEKP